MATFTFGIDRVTISPRIRALSHQQVAEIVRAAAGLNIEHRHRKDARDKLPKRPKPAVAIGA